MRQISLFPDLERPDPIQNGGGKVSKKQSFTPKQPEKVGSRFVYPDDFEEFWSHYPRKDSKADAYAIWQRCIHKGYKRGLMIVRAEQFARSEVGMGLLQHIPMARTWLGQLRFLDDPKEWDRFGADNAKRPDNAGVDWDYKG